MFKKIWKEAPSVILISVVVSIMVMWDWREFKGDLPWAVFVSAGLAVFVGGSLLVYQFVLFLSWVDGQIWKFVKKVSDGLDARARDE